MNAFQTTGLVVGVILILIALMAFALWWRPVVRDALTADDAISIRRRRRLAYALVLLPTVCFALSLTSIHQAVGMILLACRILLSAVVLIFAPSWCLAIFVHLLMSSLRRQRLVERDLTTISGAGVWSTFYAFSTYEAVTRGIALYKSLPTSPPGCFVVSAAANGHPRFVGSANCRTSDGMAFSVNHQLRYFKAFEIALAAASPTVHTGVRLIYNRAGPWMASLIRHPIAADLAYVSMKPAEWVIRGTFRIFLPASFQVIETLWNEQHIYTASHSSALQKRRRTCAGKCDGKGGATRRRMMHQPMSFKGRRQSGVKCEDSENPGQ